MPIEINPNVITTQSISVPPVQIQPADLDTIITMLEAAGVIASSSVKITASNLLSLSVDRKNDGVVDGNGNSLLYFEANIRTV